jgi:hypothetical protein
MVREFGMNGGYDHFFRFGIGFGNDFGSRFFPDSGYVAES